MTETFGTERLTGAMLDRLTFTPPATANPASYSGLVLHRLVVGFYSAVDTLIKIGDMYIRNASVRAHVTSQDSGMAPQD